MSDKIGEMRARIQLIFREIKEDKNGEFSEKKSLEILIGQG